MKMFPFIETHPKWISQNFFAIGNPTLNPPPRKKPRAQKTIAQEPNSGPLPPHFIGDTDFQPYGW